MEYDDVIQEFGITKLNLENYKYWSFNMKLVLEEIDVWDAVAEPESILDPNVRKKKSLKALRVILQGVSSKEIECLIYDCETSKAAWDTLQNHFQPKTRWRLSRLKREFYTAQMKSGETMCDYIIRVKELASDIAYVQGKRVEDEDIALVLLGGLPADYKCVLIAEIMSEEDFTLNRIENLINSEYDVKNRQMTKLASSGEKLVPLVKDSMKKEIICFRCGGKNHIAKFCKSKSKNKNVK